MGILSKIFQTDKLSYILRENEDEFNVDAPKSWNVIELGVGDTITPNMFKDGQFSFWKREGSDFFIQMFGNDGYKDYVRIDYINKRGKPTSTLMYIDDLNSMILKPEYKVFPPNVLNESDEFNVDAPENWNVHELGVGDFLDSSNLKMQDPFKKFEIKRIYQDYWGQSVELDVHELVEEPVLGTYGQRSTRQWKVTRQMVVNVPDLKRRLKPNFEIDLSGQLDESEFDIDSPEGWNVKELTAGDTIKSDWIKPSYYEKHTYKGYVEPGDDLKILQFSRIGGQIYVLIQFPYHPGVKVWEELNWFNSEALKPDYQVVVDELSSFIRESEDDEWIVDTPEGWNVKELTVGDRITPDMLKNPDRHDYELNHFLYHPEYRVEIKKVDTDQFGEYVVLYITTPEDIVREKRDLDALNSLLKPDYQIVSPTNLKESEFDVEAPEDWDKEYLTVGDKITPDMWKNLKKIGNWDRVHEKFKTYYIINFGEDEWGSYVALNHKQHSDGYDQRWDLDDVNDNLKHPYVVINNLKEGEFDVEAPKDWEKEYLKVGDKITPDMWEDPSKFVINEPVYIHDIGTDEGGDFVLLGTNVTDIGFDSTWDLDEINHYLKHPYIIDMPLNEQDDFNVDAPEDWSKITLTKGDYITPDMWKEIPKKFSNPPQSVEIGGFGLAGDANDVEEVRLIRSDLPHVAWSWELNTLNNALKNPYQVVYPMGTNYRWRGYLEENESDDEFSVVAPKEWDNFPIIIEVTNYYNFWHGDDDYMDEVTETKVVETTSEELEQITGVGIPHNAGAIEELIGNNWTKYDELMDLIYEEGKVTEPIPDVFYSEGWENEWEDISFRVTLPDKINEQDEFSVVAPEDWDQEEWRGNFYSDEDYDSFTKWVTRILKKHGFKEKKIDLYLDDLFHYSDVDLYQHVMEKDLVNDFEEYWRNEDELNELDDEFSVDAPEDWNEFSLSEGDDITLDMVEPGSSLEQLILRSTDKKIHIRRFYDDLVVFEVNLPPNKFIKEPHTDIIKLGWEYLEGKQLKPNYKFRPNGLPHNFDTLNELLSEKEDEFDVKAPEDWNVQELEVGDIITPDMWKNPKTGTDFGNVKIEEIYFEDYYDPEYGDDINGDENNYVVKVVFDNSEPKYLFGAKYSLNYLNWEMGELNDALKPQYRIFPPNNLNESDDEWEVDAPAEWNEIILTVGSKITPDMWNTQAVINAGEEDEFLNDEIWTITDIVSRYVTMSSNGGGYIDWSVDDVQSLLKSQYKIIKSLNESEDEFKVTAPKEWNQKEITTGDTFKIKDTIYQIGEFDPDGRHVEVKRKKDNKYLTFPISLVQNKLPKNTILVKSSKKLSELLETDDEFDVDAPKEWGITQLTKGDTITPYMWKNIDESLTNWFKKLGAESPTDILIKEIKCWDYEDKDCIVRLILKNKSFSLKNIVKKSYYDSFGSPTYNSGWFDWDEWMSINELNDLLKPQYKIVSPENLHESDDEFNVVAPREWSVDPNTPIYIKRYRVLKAIDNNDQEGYVEETLETTYTIDELETVFRKNYPYDNISEELLTKWIYDNQFYYLDWDSTEINIDFESSDDGFDVDNVSTWDTEDDVIEVSLN